MKVFISSTYRDLIEYREKAIEVVLRYECEPLAMEYFNAQQEDPTTVCEKEIRECDVFIGIYAHRYGYIPKGENKSTIQLEYELAKKLKKDCLYFIVEEKFPWKLEFIEKDKYRKLDAFLNQVKKDYVVESFKSPEHFMGVLSTSLAKYIEKRRGKLGREESRIKGSYSENQPAGIDYLQGIDRFIATLKGKKIFIGQNIFPKQYDIAFASCNAIGNPGELNSFVLNNLGYNVDDLPKFAHLKSGYTWQEKSKLKPIIFVVTVGASMNVESALKTNIYHALVEYRDKISNKRLWVPLMGTGGGRTGCCP